MKTSVKSWIKAWCPPVLLRLRQERGAVRYDGDFGDWKSAERMSSGYQAAGILEKVAEATRQVLAGKAVFERDSHLFFQEEPNYPLAACLLHAAARNAGRLRIVDFGGALGSVFFQNRRLLEGLKELSWNIVEQPHFVECGRQLPVPDCLRFHCDFQKTLSEIAPDVVLFSSVLQYLPDPWDVLEKAAASGAEFLLIDRTPLLTGTDRCRFAVQTVPAVLYAAQYPIQFIGEKRLLEFLQENFELVTRFESYPVTIRLKKEREPIHYHGLFWKRRDV